MTQSSDEINIASNQIVKDLINSQPITPLAEHEELLIDGLEGRFGRKILGSPLAESLKLCVQEIGKLKELLEEGDFATTAIPSG